MKFFQCWSCLTQPGLKVVYLYSLSAISKENMRWSLRTYIYRHTYYTCFLANIASICPAPSHTGGIGTASDTELAGCEPLGRWSWHELGDVGAHGGPKFNMFLLV